MEGRKNKTNVTKVSVTGLQLLSTGCADISLARNAHAPIERSIFSVCAAFVQVKKSAVGEFDLRLVDYVLIRPVPLLEPCLHIPPLDRSYKTPNCNSLMTFGTSLTTCSLPGHWLATSVATGILLSSQSPTRSKKVGPASIHGFLLESTSNILGEGKIKASLSQK